MSNKPKKTGISETSFILYKSFEKRIKEIRDDNASLEKITKEVDSSYAKGKISSALAASLFREIIDALY